MNPDFELFERFKKLALELQSTAAVVQNDHDQLIVDEMISADDVRRNTVQFIERCESHISELLTLQSATVRRLDAVLAALDKKPTSTSESD